jgi:hypothetical protein
MYVRIEQLESRPGKEFSLNSSSEKEASKDTKHVVDAQYIEVKKHCHQIGRIIACWALVYPGLFENYRSNANFGATFFRSTSYVLIGTKHGLGYILGDFFTNSSGHPGWHAPKVTLCMKML